MNFPSSFAPMAAPPASHSTTFRYDTTPATSSSNNNNAYIPIVVLTWEDVLAPMTWLAHRIGLRSTRSAVDAAKVALSVDSYSQKALVAVEEQILALLQVASTIGDVAVVTNRSMGFMEATCTAFFPRVAWWLANVQLAVARGECHPVQVLSAPQKFTSQMEQAAWRVSVYQRICQETVARRGGKSLGEVQRRMRHRSTGSLSLLSVSASEFDTCACLKAIDIAPFLQPKCVQVRGDATPLTLEQFYAQLRTLQQYLVTAANHNSAFAVKL